MKYAAHKKVYYSGAKIALMVGTSLLFLFVAATNARSVFDTASENLVELTSVVWFVSFFVGVSIIFLFEKIFPVDDRSLINKDVLQDFLYWLVFTPLATAIIALGFAGSALWISENLSFIQIQQTKTWPVWLTLLVGFLLFDFMAWAKHLIVHKVGFLWRLHEIHHSQEVYNIFIAGRHHPLELVFGKVLSFLPLIIVGGHVIGNAKALIAFGLIDAWWSRFQHANIRTNLGVFRHVLVSPQYHRVHHSAVESHWNSNYAHVFSFWDRIFGFTNKEIDVYPSTGIVRKNFPHPTDMKLGSLVQAYGKQLAYPFKAEDNSLPAQMASSKVKV